MCHHQNFSPFGIKQGVMITNRVKTNTCLSLSIFIYKDTNISEVGGTHKFPSDTSVSQRKQKSTAGVRPKFEDTDSTTKWAQEQRIPNHTSSKSSRCHWGCPSWMGPLVNIMFPTSLAINEGLVPHCNYHTQEPYCCLMLVT